MALIEKSPSNVSNNSFTPDPAASIIEEKSSPVDLDQTSDTSGIQQVDEVGEKRSIWEAIFYGGYGTKQVGRRIAPVLWHLRPRAGDVESETQSGEDVAILKYQIDAEKDNPLQYRTCSWQKVRL